jgi:hypothetical protein
VENLPNGFSVFASMLGVDGSVLRAISVPWVSDPNHAPITPTEFFELLEEAKQLAGQLNNTNAWEQAIMGSFPSEENPRTLPTVGVPRPADHDDNGESNG